MCSPSSRRSAPRHPWSLFGAAVFLRSVKEIPLVDGRVVKGAGDEDGWESERFSGSARLL